MQAWIHSGGSSSASTLVFLASPIIHFNRQFGCNTFRCRYPSFNFTTSCTSLIKAIKSVYIIHSKECIVSLVFIVTVSALTKQEYCKLVVKQFMRYLILYNYPWCNKDVNFSKKCQFLQYIIQLWQKITPWST